MYASRPARRTRPPDLHENLIKLNKTDSCNCCDLSHLKKNRGSGKGEREGRGCWGKSSFHLFWQEEKCHHHHLPAPPAHRAAHNPYGRKRMTPCSLHGRYRRQNPITGNSLQFRRVREQLGLLPPESPGVWGTDSVLAPSDADAPATAC